MAAWTDVMAVITVIATVASVMAAMVTVAMSVAKLVAISEFSPTATGKQMGHRWRRLAHDRQGETGWDLAGHGTAD